MGAEIRKDVKGIDRFIPLRTD